MAHCEKPAESVAKEGPEICQARFTNYRATALQVGFARHPGAWRRDGKGNVRFFAKWLNPNRSGDVTWRDTPAGS